MSYYRGYSMAGLTTTQTRYPFPIPFVNYIDGRVSNIGDVGSSWASRPVQTTTSFRTGKYISGSDEELATQKLLGGGLAADEARLISDFDRAVPLSSGDSGHPFSTISSKADLGPLHDLSNYLGTPPNRHLYRATGYAYCLPSSHNVANSTFVSVPSWDSTYYGTEAIRRTSPVAPAFKASVALAELMREGIQLPLHTAHAVRDLLNLKKLSNEYLNVQFGLKPLISDIAQFLDVTSRSNQILKQYLRDSGRLVRRSTRFEEIVSASSYAPKSCNIGFTSNNSSLRPWTGTTNQTVVGTMTEYTVVKQNIRFSGAYTYYVPQADDFISRMDRRVSELEKVLGIGLDLDTLWNLAPWSWLSDWNANIGSIMTNLRNFHTDGLVLRYGYVMRETITQRTVIATSAFQLTNGYRGPFISTYETRKLERVKANPYGFAINPSNYTARQWSILGALGLTKAPNIL